MLVLLFGDTEHLKNSITNNMGRISRVTKYTQREVEEQLNRWIDNGWNIHEVFIQIVSEPYSITDISERKYIIFYDSSIDNENENKLEIK
jgi:hypothetical protein